MKKKYYFFARGIIIEVYEESFFKAIKIYREIIRDLKQQ